MCVHRDSVCSIYKIIKTMTVKDETRRKTPYITVMGFDGTLFQFYNI